MFHSNKVDNKSALTVLFVIDTLEIGGAEQSLLENLRRFERIRPVVCHLYRGEALKPSFIAAGIEVFSLDVPKKYGFIEASKKLKAIVDTVKPNAIVAYLTRSELVSRYVAKKVKIPVFGSFVSDLYSNEYNKKLSFKARLLVGFFKALNKYTAKYCKGFIANSESTKRVNSLHLNVPESKVVVINRGRDGRKFQFKTNKLQSEVIQLFSIGRLVSVKGHKDLILAVADANMNGVKFKLDIAGEGPERRNLEELIESKNLDNVVNLLGSRKDINELVTSYDAFFFGSYSEGFSGSIIEAMMAGLPVLVSDIPVNQEVVSHMETGYVFKTADTKSATSALEWLYHNRSQALIMAERANEIARSKFELNTIATQLEEYLLTQIS